MKYEPEFIPVDSGEDVVFTLNSTGRAAKVEVPDDQEEAENADNH